MNLVKNYREGANEVEQILIHRYKKQYTLSGIESQILSDWVKVLTKYTIRLDKPS